jgi:hypothetical protein
MPRIATHGFHADTVSPSRESIRSAAVRDALDELGPVVYYVRRRGLVKIGWSSELRERLRKLHVKPADLLAVQCGERADEADMHRRFEHLRVVGDGLGVEHYRLAADLLDHVNELRRGLNLPEV